MKRIAPELESLMWTLAEEENDRAIDEFGERHPELRTELLHRIAMVKGLRGAKKKTAEPVKTIPRFVPKEVKTNGPIYVVTGLVLAALAALAFAVTVMLTPTHRATTEPAVPTAVNGPQPNSTAPQQQLPPVTRNSPVPKIDPALDQVDEAKELKPGTLRIEHAPLLTVLQMMSETCGVRIDPAPGMPNPDVVVDYRDMNAMQMLRDLGRQYSFTALNQHDGSILVVPAVDPRNSTTDDSSTGPNQERKVGG